MIRIEEEREVIFEMNKIIVAAVLVIGVLLVGLIPASLGCTSDTSDILNVDSEGNSSIDQGSLESYMEEKETGELTEIEIEGLLFMREEEKLARDVYDYLYSVWGIRTFDNISSSEQTHTDAIKSLLDVYGLDDPAKDKTPGEFTNDTLQQLYLDLKEQGSISIADALKVGATIEEIDILDIEKYIAQTDNEDIIFVYENLIKGSENHLNAFVSVMERQGIQYIPQYITT